MEESQWQVSKARAVGGKTSYNSARIGISVDSAVFSPVIGVTVMGSLLALGSLSVCVQV